MAHGAKHGQVDVPIIPLGWYAVHRKGIGFNQRVRAILTCDF